MKLNESLKRLTALERQGICLFTKADLGVMFQEHGDTLASTIKRLSGGGVLERVANGIYLNTLARQGDSLLYQAAAMLRPGEVNYLSNESVLCNLSIISQQMLDRITVMTTGSSGTFRTPLGVIEFTHTKRDPMLLLQETTRPEGFPIRVANKHIAVRDLKRIGRNTDMIDWEEFHESD